MSTVTLSPSHPFAEIVGAVETALRTIRAAHRASRDFQQLNALTDRQLADIGLDRADLQRVVHAHYFA